MTDLDILAKLQEKIDAARRGFEPARKLLENDIASLVAKHKQELAMLFEFEGRSTLSFIVGEYKIKIIK